MISLFTDPLFSLKSQPSACDKNINSGELRQLLRTGYVVNCRLFSQAMTSHFFLQITICIAFSCLADFDRELELAKYDDKFSERFDFFMAVFIIGWVVVLLVFLVFLFSLTEKDWTLAVSIRGFV